MDIERDTQLIFFSIGNPGSSNRHSTGHVILKKMTEYYKVHQLVKPSPKSLYSMTRYHEVLFVKSNAYMNESKKALDQFIKNENINLLQSKLFVIFDDFEINMSLVKLSSIKKNSSHNGIKSIKQYSATNGYNSQIYQLGIGIGPKPSNATKDQMASWVLSRFKQDEKNILEQKSFPLLLLYIDYIIDHNGEINDCGKLNSFFKKTLQID